MFNAQTSLFEYATRAVPPVHIVVNDGHVALKELRILRWINNLFIVPVCQQGINWPTNREMWPPMGIVISAAGTRWAIHLT
jgi:hypothetical protein